MLWTASQLCQITCFFSKNTPHREAGDISSLLGIEPTEDLGLYLGILILTSREGKADYSFIIDKFRTKLSGWKANSLSQAGRITLAQSCIMSVPSYGMQTAKLPASICDEVERLCRDFIRGSTPEARKHHLVSWEMICAPKEEGGLGFRSLRLVNKSYLMKLGWGLLHASNIIAAI